MPDMKLLQIYLNDHLAGAVAGVELAKRACSNNEGTEFESFLTRIRQEVDEDKSMLEDVIDRLELKKSVFKQSAGWMAEKAGRLKLNGQVTGYSDLSRLLELEGLTIGVEGKLSMWENLKAVAGTDSRLATFDFDTPIKRAVDQLEGLKEHRAAAAMRAFA